MFQGFIAGNSPAWSCRNAMVPSGFQKHKDLGNPPRLPTEGNGTQTIYFPDEKPKFHRELVNMLMLPTCFLFRAKKGINMTF